MRIKLSGINEETGKAQNGYIFYNPDTSEVLITYPDDIERKRLYRYLTTPQLLTHGIPLGQSDSDFIGHHKKPDTPSDSTELLLHALSDMQGWISIAADWRNPVYDDHSTLKSLKGDTIYKLI